MKYNVQGYLSAVMKRLEQPKIKQMLQFAKCDPSKMNAPLTNEVGLRHTMDNILTSAKNMYEACKGRDIVAEMVTNFSADGGVSDGIGYSDVSNVNTIGAIDVTLTARADSLIPYVCADRALPTPDAVVYFQNLVALNSAGGFTAGDRVIGSYTVPNMKIDLDLEKAQLEHADMDAEVEGTQVAFGAPIVPGKVKVVVDLGGSAEKIVGQDFTGNGTIYFDGKCMTGKIDYTTGIVTLDAADGTTGQVHIEAIADSNKSEVGNGILRVGPEYTNIQLHSIPQNIILENNMLSQAYMDKTYTLATGATNAPYNDQIFQSVRAAYTEFLNKKVLIPMVQNTLVADSVLDLSSYALNDFAYTKNDMISQAISNMMAALLARTGVGVTTIVTNSYGAALLMNVPNLFVASPEASKSINSLVGYWQGIPVFRHNYLDVVYGMGDTAQFIGCYKAPDNSAASTIYGEFLPFTSTGLVGNFMNPTQIANGYFSQVGVSVVQSNLFTRTQVHLPKLAEKPGTGTGNLGTPSWNVGL